VKRTTFTLGLKRSDFKTDHSSESSAEVKNTWSFATTSPIRLQWWFGHRGDFTFIVVGEKWQDNYERRLGNNVEGSGHKLFKAEGHSTGNAHKN